MTEIEILNSIKELTGFSVEELAGLLNKFERKVLKKKTRLLSPGETADEVYLILQGCMRLYYEKDGQDISAYFFTEGMFSGAFDSFTSQQPTRHFIETLEDCHVVAVSYNGFKNLFIDFPRMDEFVRKILEERFISLHQLFTAQILDSPEERYINLRKFRPDLINRIPQHHLATFLGITPVSLSRIRSRVIQKK